MKDRLSERETAGAFGVRRSGDDNDGRSCAFASAGGKNGGEGSGGSVAVCDVVAAAVVAHVAGVVDTGEEVTLKLGRTAPWLRKSDTDEGTPPATMGVEVETAAAAKGARPRVVATPADAPALERGKVLPCKHSCESGRCSTAHSGACGTPGEVVAARLTCSPCAAEAAGEEDGDDVSDCREGGSSPRDSTVGCIARKTSGEAGEAVAVVVETGVAANVVAATTELPCRPLSTLSLRKVCGLNDVGEPPKKPVLAATRVDDGGRGSRRCSASSPSSPGAEEEEEREKDRDVCCDASSFSADAAAADVAKRSDVPASLTTADDDSADSSGS